VPKQVVDEHEQMLETCMQFLQCYCENGETFLQQSVTSDETWVHHNEPACNCQSMEWKHMSSPRTKKFKCPFCWQSDVDPFGILMGPSCSTSRIMDRWWTVHIIVLWLKSSWNLLFAINVEDC